MRHHSSHRNILRTVLFSVVATLCLNACGDVSNVSGPPAPASPGPLTILTSSPLPAGTAQADYNVTLAPIGGTPPYTWSLSPGSPTLPDSLELTPSNGKILGVPTTATATKLIEFRLQDSKGKSVQKVLAITVNAAPIPLAIITNSLPTGSINQLYAFALSPTGGTSPYTWNLKNGSPPLPNGLTLTANGIISGTPTVTSTATHTFTLTDVTTVTVEKALHLSINAIALSITTNSLPQGTANQNYSAQLAASGGTGVDTWGLAGGSPALPTGLTLNASTGLISGVPTGLSSLTHTFTVTDQTPPTPQTSTKTLQLIIGAAPPDLIISSSSPLPSGTVTQPYNVTLIASGGTGTKTWDISAGSLPAGLNLSTSGVINGTPLATGTSKPTVRVRDSGNPQDTATKPLSITINLPAAPNITTTSLPAGALNVAYDQTVSVTGGIGTPLWGVTSGALPPGFSLDTTNGNISGTPTSSGSFQFTLRVTDSIPQFDEQILTITINSPAPPSITTSSLPTGTVNQPYSNTQLTAAGGALPYSWSANPALPNGLTLNPASGVISGIPLSGSTGNSTHEFTVTDSTIPINLQGKKTLSLTIIENDTPVTITTKSLPDGKRNQTYTATLAVSGGVIPYTWSVTPALPAGLTLAPATGMISGTPRATSNIDHNFTVRDSTNQTTTKKLKLRIRNSAPSDDDD